MSASAASQTSEKILKRRLVLYIFILELFLTFILADISADDLFGQTAVNIRFDLRRFSIVFRSRAFFIIVFILKNSLVKNMS